MKIENENANQTHPKLVEIWICYHIIKAIVIFLFIYMIDVKGQGIAFHNHSLNKQRPIE